MDILTHALSGTAVATCAMNYVPSTFARKFKIVLAGTIGGAFPDLDAVSMWSRFDSTFGKIFGLEYSGKVIYGSKLWYSHHAFFHSVVASVVFGVLLLLSIYPLKTFRNKDPLSFLSFSKSHLIYPLVFIFGFWAHLAGDIPTPASVWSGIDLFWPSKSYVGGYGKIWWWNNYDIFLIIVCCIILNLIVPVLFRYIRKNVRLFTASVLIVGLSLILLQVNTRQYNYAYTGNTSKYAEFEQNSKREQQRILGKRLYRYMERFDGILKFYF